MFNLRNVLQLVDDGLNNSSATQQELISQRQEAIVLVHIPSALGMMPVHAPKQRHK